MTRRAATAVGAAVVLYLVATAFLAAAATARTGGRLIYPLDDTYVHMAIAKHFAVDGVWGVTSDQFASASSSPLWTGVLAFIYAMTGVSEIMPLALNLIAGVALLISVHQLVAETATSRVVAPVWTFVVLFAGALPTVTLIGMEHTVHALLTVWFVILGSQYATAPDHQTGLLRLLLLAAIMVLTRYESMFTVVCVSLACLGFGKWRAAFAIVTTAALAVLLFGVWSIAHGGYLLPNSVLLKGAAPGFTWKESAQLITLWRAQSALMASPHLMVLVLTAIGLSTRVVLDSRSDRAMAWVFAGAVLLHLQFASIGWFFRYENYLVVLGLVIVGRIVGRLDWAAKIRQPIDTATAVLLIVLLAFPLASRGLIAVRDTPGASSNIFEQQYQMALFLDQFYRDQRVAVNDVGFIGFLADVKLLDVWGLASTETTSLKRSGTYTTEAIDRLAKEGGVEIAVIYPSWLAEYGGVPAHWQEVGAWHVANRVVLGSASVSFFAVREASRDSLTRNLAAFSSQLPHTVRQTGDYLVPR